jgi:hypothetical protein
MSVFLIPEHLLVAYPFPAHVVGILAEDLPHFVVQPVLHHQFFGHHRGDRFGRGGRIGGFYDVRR